MIIVGVCEFCFLSQTLHEIQLLEWLISTAETPSCKLSRMATQLTLQQHDDLTQHGKKPMPVIDPVDQKVYFLVPVDVFERVRLLFDESPSDIQHAEMIQSEVAGTSGWDDASMDKYDNYDAHKRQ